MDNINEKSIWNSRQNHPELVIDDCRREFGFTDEQCQKLRFIMMNRGVNKWLYARRLFIDLKHQMKTKLTAPTRKDYLKAYEKMQNICKMPRWVEWGQRAHKNMKNSEAEIVVKGRPC